MHKTLFHAVDKAIKISINTKGGPYLPQTEKLDSVRMSKKFYTNPLNHSDNYRVFQNKKMLLMFRIKHFISHNLPLVYLFISRNYARENK